MLIRLQDKTPPVYSDESRDFQTFLRAYDYIVNGIKNDIDTVKYLTDTKFARADILQLLQTKLGFFTEAEIDSEALRKILVAFPYLVRRKGSLWAVKKSVIVYLKTLGFNCEVYVENVVTDEDVEEVAQRLGMIVKKHSIVIGMNCSLKNVLVLREILKYILPAGYGCYFAFYGEKQIIESIPISNMARLLYVSDNLNSRMRGSEQDAIDDFIVVENDDRATSMRNRVIGQVDTIGLIGSDNPLPERFDENCNYVIGDIICKEVIVSEVPKTYIYECIENIEPGEFDVTKWKLISTDGPKLLPTDPYGPITIPVEVNK